jgi:hypothetical protein
MDKLRVLLGWPERVRDPECMVELSKADIQRFPEAAVPVCGCGGSCGDERERDDSGEEEGDGDAGNPA